MPGSWMESSEPPIPIFCHPGKLRLGQFDFVDQLEIRGVEDEHRLPKDVQKLSVGRKTHLSAESEPGLIFVFGNVRRAHDLFLRQIDHAELGFLVDLEAILFFSMVRNRTYANFACGIGRPPRIRNCLAPSFSTNEFVTLRVATSTISMPVFSMVVTNSVLRSSESCIPPANARGKIDGVDDLLPGFVHDLNRVRPSADEKGPWAGARAANASRRSKGADPLIRARSPDRADGPIRDRPADQGSAPLLQNKWIMEKPDRYCASLWWRRRTSRSSPDSCSDDRAPAPARSR